MKVILLQDVKTLGKKGEIVDINDGYARNFVLPKKLGIEASNKNINDLKLKNANDAKLVEQQLEAAKDLAARLESMQATVAMKMGEGGKAFGSISSKEIAQAFKDQCDVELDKKKILMNEPIKSFGTFHVDIKLHTKVTGKLTIKVQEA